MSRELEKAANAPQQRSRKRPARYLDSDSNSKPNKKARKGAPAIRQNIPIGRRLAPEQNNADIANRPHTRERRKRKTRATYSPGDDAAHDAQRSVDEPTPTFVMLC